MVDLLEFLFQTVVVPWLACKAALCIFETVLDMAHAPLHLRIFSGVLLQAELVRSQDCMLLPPNMLFHTIIDNNFVC